MLLFSKVMPCIDLSARWKFRLRKSRMATTLFDVWKWCYRSPSRVMLPGLHGRQGMRLERERCKLSVWVRLSKLQGTTLLNNVIMFLLFRHAG